jgi:hypothetical protein
MLATTLPSPRATQLLDNHQGNTTKPGYGLKFTALLKLTRTDTDERYMTLPAETSPVFAPDRLSVWPVEDERYGLDATYHGATGFERAEAQRQRLQTANLSASVRQELGDDWTLRLGPLTHGAAWTAIEAFLGPPVPRTS